jgi:hypothetical protein
MGNSWIEEKVVGRDLMLGFQSLVPYRKTLQTNI